MNMTDGLDLSRNNITGVLSMGTFSNMTSLEILRLGSNSLSGILPSAIINLTDIEYIDLSFNAL